MTPAATQLPPSYGVITPAAAAAWGAQLAAQAQAQAQAQARAVQRASASAGEASAAAVRDAALRPAAPAGPAQRRGCSAPS
mmetsp:Transcript_43484/g.142692  ORF Transcript_43484/g.142692 Transcript_43484/m.142692 type:complete len:81 (+) Transcript_43484:2047-2289(+)